MDVLVDDLERRLGLQGASRLVGASHATPAQEGRVFAELERDERHLHGHPPRQRPDRTHLHRHEGRLPRHPLVVGRPLTAAAIPSR